MSASGHKRKSQPGIATSTLALEADIRSDMAHVCFVPKPEVASLFDHLVGGGK